MSKVQVPVLIVGGGPVGLTASLLLSRHGVRSLLVERHPGTSMHPKARGLNVRTLELFRVQLSAPLALPEQPVRGWFYGTRVASFDRSYRYRGGVDSLDA